MVFVNGKKFACESCIKGHRSSSCHHTQRPLFEIKKKGRPVSQCEKCRELRQSRRVHSKCNCPQEEQPSRGLLLPSSSAKSRRYIPVAPALPNGLRDALRSEPTPGPSNSRQRVDSLLNPCGCRSGCKCNCRGSDSGGLAALAHAAVMCCSSGNAEATSSPNPIAPSDLPPTRPKRPLSRPNSPQHGLPHKRSKRPASTRIPGPALPPLLCTEDDGPTLFVPVFATMPPMSTIKSLAGSGCCCGVECACPGCVQHRGSEHADTARPDCADGCGTCVDAQAPRDIMNKSPSPFYISSTIIDDFLARAAVLPAPPSKASRSWDLDPRDVSTAPVGQVRLPKLECCSGKCACAPGACRCVQSCNGRCAEHRASLKQTPRHQTILAPSPAKSCCTG